MPRRFHASSSAAELRSYVAQCYNALLLLLLLGVFFRILPGRLFKLLGLVGQLLRNLFLERMIGLRIAQQRNHRQQTVLRIQRWTPVAQHGAANFSRFQQDARMVHFGRKDEFGRFERVLRGKFEAQQEFTARVRRVARTCQGAGPVENVVLDQINVQDEIQRLLLQFGAFLFHNRV
jgi:hypothetical protein